MSRRIPIDAAALRTPRSSHPITQEHLERLSRVAREDHDHFVRADGGRPRYADRRLAVVLAQGAALHYVNGPDGSDGVKDLDVYTFYAAVPGARFPCDRRVRSVDFGFSELGLQGYEFDDARNDQERRRWQRWSTQHLGRRVDLMMRALPTRPGAEFDEVAAAVVGWLRLGARSRKERKPTPWWLAQKAVVIIDPPLHRGRIVWPPRV